MHRQKKSATGQPREVHYKESINYGFDYELLADQAEKAFQAYLDSGMEDVGYLATAALISFNALEYLLPPITIRAAARFHNTEARESLENQNSKFSTGILNEMNRLSGINKTVIAWINRHLYDCNSAQAPTPYAKLIHELIEIAPMLLAIENLAIHFKHSESRDSDSLITVDKIEGFRKGGTYAGDTLGMITFSATTHRSRVRIDIAVKNTLDIIRRHQNGMALYEIIENEIRKSDNP